MDKKKLEDSTRARNERIVTQDLCANLVGKGFAQIKPMDILACIKKIEERGAHEVASRARGMAIWSNVNLLTSAVQKMPK